jgi:hypothetical protein
MQAGWIKRHAIRVDLFSVLEILKAAPSELANTLWRWRDATFQGA